MGLLGNLFSRKTKYVDEPDTAATPPQSQEYFLDSDEAQGLGNLDYMRTAKAVKKTFPKGMGSAPEAVSSLETTSMKSTTPAPAPTAKPTSQSDNSLDRFRQMAREVKRNS